MKKGLHIVCASGLVLAVSIAAIGCQKNTVETVPETTVPVTETIIELAEDESMTEADKETLIKQDKETKKEAKEDKKEALKESKKETSKKEDKKETSQKETQKPSKSETGSSTPQKPTGTQKPSKPTETQKPSKPSETKPQKPAETQKPSKPVETKPQEPAETKPQHQHDWAAKTELITHPEEGHYETVVVKEAWDEPIYETKVVCGCGAMFNDVDSWGQHSIDGCIYGYSVQSVQVGSKHHDAVTQQQWVVDKKAWYESVIVGYECQCGAIKK